MSRPSHTLDNLDIKILGCLQRDARLTNAELAEKINLSPSPTLARVRALESKGVIQRSVALLDPVALGLAMTVLVSVTVDKQDPLNTQNFEDTIKTFDEVMTCHLVSGDADYQLRVVVADMRQLEYFLLKKLSKIKQVIKVQTSFALKEVINRTELPLTQLAAAI